MSPREQLHEAGFDDAEIARFLESALEVRGEQSYNIGDDELTYWQVGPSVAFALNGKRIGFIPV